MGPNNGHLMNNMKHENGTMCVLRTVSVEHRNLCSIVSNAFANCCSIIKLAGEIMVLVERDTYWKSNATNNKPENVIFVLKY